MGSGQNSPGEMNPGKTNPAERNHLCCISGVSNPGPGPGLGPGPEPTGLLDYLGHMTQVTLVFLV